MFNIKFFIKFICRVSGSKKHKMKFFTATALLLVLATITNAVKLEIKPFKRLIPADVLRGKFMKKKFLQKCPLSFILYKKNFKNVEKHE